MKGGKAAMAKMEMKIREFGAELASSRGLIARAKNFLLPKERIGKIKTACLSWLPSSKER